MRKSTAALGVAALVIGVWALAVAAAAGNTATHPQQARKLNKIKAVEGGAISDEVLAAVGPIPDARQCRDAAEHIAASYRAADIGSVLHEDFPNRAELIDALSRAELRVTNLSLSVDGVDSARVQPWQLIDRKEGDDTTRYTVASDCIVELRFRLVFDDSSSGQRTVSDAIRGEWRIRFSAEVDVRGDGLP